MSKPSWAHLRALVAACVLSSFLAPLQADYPILSGVDLYPHGNIICHDLAYHKGIVYTSSHGGGAGVYTLESVDVRDPHNLQYLASAGAGDAKAYGVKIVDDTLYVAFWFSGVRVFHLPGNGNMQYLWTYCPDGEPAYWDLDVYRNRVYATASDEPGGAQIWGVRTLDVSNLTPPDPNNILISLLPTDDRNIRAVAVRGSYMFYTDGLTFEVANVSDELNPYILARRELPAANCLTGVLLYGDCAFVHAAGGTPGFVAYDISDPTNPVELKRLDAQAQNVWLMGNRAFLAGGGSGLTILDISNPRDPVVIDHAHVDSATDARVAWEHSVTGNGPYIYVGTMEEYWIDGNNYYHGKVYALQAFPSDPDDEGPSDWKNISIGEPSWDSQYLANSLPSAASPVWKPVDGSEALATVDNGVLEIRDAGTGSADKVKWSRNWDVTNTDGGTIVVRARCLSYDPGAADYRSILNLSVEDGKYVEEFAILSDRIRANRANLEYALNGTAWHTYRITTQGNQFKVYVDEAELPALQGNLWVTTSRARLTLGSFSSAARQEIDIDEVSCCSTGASTPTLPLSTPTPNIEINVAETAGKGSLSGIVPASAAVRWSTDGGVTWASSGDQWETGYEGNELPSAAVPPWTVLEGIEGLGTVSAGVLCVADNSTTSGSKIKWSRAWRAIPSHGTTVMARIRCTAAAGDTTYLDNLVLEDGVHRERFRILPNRIEAVQAGLAYALDATAWHTYRVNTLGNTFNLYVDEQPTPVMSGTMTATTSENRFWFGTGASAGTQTIYFDYIRCTGRAALPPGQGDAGATVGMTCTGALGVTRAVVTAYSVPFNQYSATLNKVQFTLKDLAGNVGFSPVYNVRIGQLTASDLDDDRDVDQADFGRLQCCLSGTNTHFPTDCGKADLDADGDVDDGDIVLFLGCVSGPDNPADERCAD
jgi:hypothetical protein